MPHSIEAEQAVLGALALWHEGIVEVADDLEPEDFYAAGHRVTYAVIRDLHRQRRPVDLVTIGDTLERRGELERAGGQGYLPRLAAATPTALHLRYYADIVIHLARLRALFDAGQATSAEALDDAAGGDADALIARAEERLATLALRVVGGGGARRMEDIVTSYLAYLDDVAEGRAIGVKTNFYDLDTLLGGLQRGDLIVLAARPSVGKTAFAVCVMRHVLLAGGRVALFSLEMSHTQIMERLICVDGALDARRVRTGQLDDAEWQALHGAAARMNPLDLMVDSAAAPTMIDIAATCRRMQASRPIDLVIVDYLQLVRGDADAENRVQAVGGVSRDLKALAREMNVPVLALAQLARRVDERADHRPVLSDLRESGEIEQNADVVLFLYRDSVYNADADPHLADLIVSKQRNGPTGVVPLFWEATHTRFASLARATSPTVTPTATTTTKGA